MRKRRRSKRRRGDGARPGVARDVRSFLVAVFLLLATASAGSAAPALVPAPWHVETAPCHGSISLAKPLQFPRDVDAGGFELLQARWRALGIPAPVVVARNATPDSATRDGAIYGGANCHLNLGGAVLRRRVVRGQT